MAVTKQKKVKKSVKLEFGKDGFPVTTTEKGDVILKIKPSTFDIEGKTEKQVAVAKAEYALKVSEHKASRVELKAEQARLKVAGLRDELEAIKSGKVELVKLSKKEQRLQAQLAKIQAKKAEMLK